MLCMHNNKHSAQRFYLFMILFVSSGNQQGSGFLDELQEHEHLLDQCIGELESAEATRVSLVSQLKEALQDQVYKLPLVLFYLKFCFKCCIDSFAIIIFSGIKVGSHSHTVASKDKMIIFSS